MNTSKLKEALTELQAQRTIIDDAIVNLQKIIATINGSSESTPRSIPTAISSDSLSYVDIAVAALELHGKPMHIKELAHYISQQRKKNIFRGTVEATIGSHIKKMKTSSRIVKVGPGLFALPQWQQLPKSEHEISATQLVKVSRNGSIGSILGEIMAEAGHPLHVRNIFEAYKAKGGTASYATTTSTLVRLVKSGKFKRTATSTYTLQL